MMFGAKQQPENSNITTGQKGELLAAEFLKRNGYRVIEANFRRTYGEIDIVATKRNILIFVEVKTMIVRELENSNYERGIQPEDQMTAAKLSKLRKICSAYANQKPQLASGGWQMDLIAIKALSAVDLTISSKDVIIKQYQNI